MAIAVLNPALVAIRGRVGNVVFKTYRTRGRNKIVLTRVPRFDGYVPSPAQQARRARLREATAYAKRVYQNPAAKAHYVAAAQKLRRQPFRLAISDYLHDRPLVSFSSAIADRLPVPPPRSSDVGRGLPTPPSPTRERRGQETPPTMCARKNSRALGTPNKRSRNAEAGRRCGRNDRARRADRNAGLIRGRAWVWDVWGVFTAFANQPPRVGHWDGCAPLPIILFGWKNHRFESRNFRALGLPY